MSKKRMTTVLIIEDDLDLMELMALLLEQEGYHVERAAHGREGLEAIARRVPDLILLDMRMPVMNGWQFAREFHERYDRMRPIVVVTAAADAGKRAKEIEADDVVPKPFGADDLLDKVRRLTARPAEGA